MRVKTKLQKDKKFKERLANIENNILKGQTQTWPPTFIDPQPSFGEVVYKLKKPAHRIILMRINVNNRSEKWPQIKKLLDSYGESCVGRFEVVDENKYRFRPLLYIR